MDGSSRSLVALDVAVALAARMGAAVTGVLVCTSRAAIELDLAWLNERITQADVRSLLIVADDVPGSLLDLCDDRPGSVLCLSSHGRGGLREAVLGSVTGHVVRDSTAPVLLVGPHARPPRHFTELVVCVHGPPARLAGPAGTWAAALRVSPRLVAVQAVDEVLADATPAGHELAWLEAALGPLEAPPVVDVLHGDATSELLHLAGSVEPALVIAATEARTGAAALVPPSVPRRLLRELGQPMLLVGPSVSP